MFPERFDYSYSHLQLKKKTLEVKIQQLMQIILLFEIRSMINKVFGIIGIKLNITIFKTITCFYYEIGFIVLKLIIFTIHIFIINLKTR